MGRDLSPITKQSRREGLPLHPKAMRIMIKRTNPPGQHGNSGKRTQTSQYSLQLREKQKAKRLYGLMERQFAKLMKQASRKTGQTGDELMSLLERRLDNVVFRAGFAPSRQSARQLVNHGHFALNGKQVNIPSISVSAGDEIILRPKSQKNNFFANLEDIMVNTIVTDTAWLTVDKAKFTIKVQSLPTRQDAEQDVNEQLIVEYYSR